MSTWTECAYCKGRGSISIEYNERCLYTTLILERITGRKTCPHCDGEGKILIE